MAKFAAAIFLVFYLCNVQSTEASPLFTSLTDLWAKVSGLIKPVDDAYARFQSTVNDKTNIITTATTTANAALTDVTNTANNFIEDNNLSENATKCVNTALDNAKTKITDALATLKKSIDDAISKYSFIQALYKELKDLLASLLVKLGLIDVDSATTKVTSMTNSVTQFANTVIQDKKTFADTISTTPTDFSAALQECLKLNI